MSELKHIGVARRSGRYPWGSGGHSEQRNTSIRGRVRELKKQGLTESEIAVGLGYGPKGTSKLRADISLEKAAERKALSTLAQRLKDKGYSDTEIGRRIGKNESSVRSLLDPVMQERAMITERTADMLRAQVEKHGYLDVGAGVENQLGVSKTRVNVSIAELQKDGYKIHYVRTPQLGTKDKLTSVKVLTKGDVDYQTVYKNKDKIRTITEWSEDGGRSFLGLEPINNISKNRIAINYAEDGGAAMDGVIQLRRGVPDISLGEARYAQVRIGVDGTHYIKGMAIYSDDLPKGVDILFNTNKTKDVPVMGDKKNTVLKNVEDDLDNPFGSTVRQKHYIDNDGKDKLSALNIISEEGTWETWSNTLSSQMLSKQSPALAKQQLDLSLKIKQDEFDEYNALTNPTVKRKLLSTFADECDADAVHLKAAAMPRQGNYVILPSTKLKPTEIYAPNYKNGETVVLIRHPHGGIFEIPQVKVNNNNPEAKSLFENIRDAVVIHPEVAKKLSGADFDGDTVLVIPNNFRNEKGQIKVAPSLKGLKDFDTNIYYNPNLKPMKNQTKQNEMGKVSNLITDMTVKGATHDEIARAVRHSMVVIDAQKHSLDYKQSARDNGIAQLKEIYQGGSNRGASTLISKSNAEIRIDRRKDKYKVDPATGKKIFTPDPESYINKKGKIVEKKTVSKQMYEVDDAYELSSGTRIESIYADYANSMKALGDRARKTAINTPPLKYSPSAKKTYSKEVESLNANLSIAISNKPMERQAQLFADKVVTAKRQANPGLQPSDMKKIKGQALAEARFRVGAKKQSIPITPKEWEAIQAGAISDSKLSAILNNADLKVVKQYATPYQATKLSPSKSTRARGLMDRGYTAAEVADMLSISTKVLLDSLKDDKGG